MTANDLPDDVRKLIENRYDQILEKQWKSFLEFHEFKIRKVAGRSVLLPIDEEEHANVKILRTITSEDDETLIIYLKNMTYVEDPKEAMWMAGFVAVCERIPGVDLFVASVYHSWFILPTLQKQISLKRKRKNAK